MILAKGYAAKAACAPLTPYSFSRRDVGPTDVLIDIKYCGVCHSDIHQVKDEWGGSIFPMVPGHEIVGLVAAVGPNILTNPQGLRVGDVVGVGCFTDSCRECINCKQGYEQFCKNGAVYTYNGYEKDQKTVSQGGYSSGIVVDQAYVLRVPKNLPMASAAPLLCAGVTTYSPLKHWKAGPGKRVAVVGLGGLGHMAVKIAHAMGAQVSVLSQSLKKKEDAQRLGADHFFSTSDPVTFESLESSFDLIINTVSMDIDWNAYLGLLVRDGTLVILGVPEHRVPLKAQSLIDGRKSIAGSLIGGIAETQEMLNFCGEHEIVSDIEIIPMQKINEAYTRVLKSDVRYRFVIDMSTLDLI